MALIGAVACSPAPLPDPSPASQWDSPNRSGLLPGDAIRVRIWREADLSGEFPVNERRVVVLPLLGAREVSGIEPAELERRLAAEYGEFLENPSIEITVLRRVTVLGEVRSPGTYRVDATVGLTEAVALAGGVTNRGDPNDIRIVRDGTILRPAVRGGVILEPLRLHSGDQIVVARRGWLERNGPLFGLGVGALGAAIAAIIVAGS